MTGAAPPYDDAVSGTIVYLDICALKRPFDDARNERIRREADAVARIFERVENGSIQLVVSPAHHFENDRNSREDRRLATDLWLQEARWFVTTDDRLFRRALESRDQMQVEVVRPDQLPLDEESES